MRWLYLALIGNLIQCGNPVIHRYLVYETNENGKPKTEKLKSALELKKSPKVILELPTPEEIDQLAHVLNINPEQKYYRLPPISILRFRLANEENIPLTVDFSDCEFENDLGEQFKLIERRSYEERFTSSAYQKFPYDAIFSFYFTKHPEKNKKEFGPYITRILPNQPVELPPGAQGEVYLPFELLNANSRLLWLHCPTLDIKKQFYYRNLRSDWEK